MWKQLPEEQREEYKRMILAFASLTEMFAQKAYDGENDNDGESSDVSKQPIPIINSKYQETVFQRVFDASAEDINNTSYDAAIRLVDRFGQERKFLIGLKTFGLNANGNQKIAQFKANRDEWSPILEQIRKNAEAVGNDKQKINEVNHDLYVELAKKIAEIRNLRIKSSEENIKGFSIDNNKDNVESVYHFLMPSMTDDGPMITVGEISYCPIDTKNLNVEGCYRTANPTNFKFSDGNHEYKFSAADSQLFMTFKEFSSEAEWQVQYAEDAYEIFSHIADNIYGTRTDKANISLAAEDKGKYDIRKIRESYSWRIVNRNGEVERFSGFNNFFGVGSKISTKYRQARIDSVSENYTGRVQFSILNDVCGMLQQYLLGEKLSSDIKLELREKIIAKAKLSEHKEFCDTVNDLVFRPATEIYIPLPKSKEFHKNHPNFFSFGGGKIFTGEVKIFDRKQTIDASSFDLIFEPSGKVIRSFITQQYGKAIESCSKQSYLGEWILYGVFQLKPYQPLTGAWLKKLGINGIRLFKQEGSEAVHLEFIWIDQDNLPDDYIGY